MEAVILEWCGYQQAAVEAANDPDIIADSETDDFDDSSSDNDPDKPSFHTQRWHLMHPRERVITRNQHFPEKMATEIIPGEFIYRKDGGTRQKRKNNRQRCKVCNDHTCYKCQKCDVYLCIKDSSTEKKCFDDFHSVENFSK